MDTDIFLRHKWKEDKEVLVFDEINKNIIKQTNKLCARQHRHEGYVCFVRDVIMLVSEEVARNIFKCYTTRSRWQLAYLESLISMG